MWDDIIIGKGDKRNTAVHCFNIKGDHSISDNATSYWINDLIFDSGMTIYKDTKEGKKLTQMIDDNIELSIILDYLNQLVLKHAKLNKVKESIDNIKNESFRLGRESIKMEFRKLLSLKK